jgi:adenylosuccinate synthase
MHRSAYIVTGLGYGDEGKGSIVDWLTSTHNAHTIIRTGGPQALHRVVTRNGTEHVFSQFGSGTLRGAATHLSKHMLIAPSALLREGSILSEKCRCNVFDYVTLHRDALIVTPVQAVTGRVRELLRGANRRGSVGVGVGETIRDAEDMPQVVLHTHDLYSAQLAQKLTQLWHYKMSQYEHYADRASGLPEPQGTAIREQLTQIAASELLQKTINEFTELAQRVRVVDDEFVAEKILAQDGTIVCEGSQGVLLDRVHGFYPYTTKVRSTPDTARDLLKSGGYSGEVQSLGVLRSYATRHGYGPFVTESETLTQVLPDAANKTDAWQGNFRVGHFDAVAARYATLACGAEAFDGLVLTCVDRTAALNTWSYCSTYRHGSSHIENLVDHEHMGNSTRSDVIGRCTPVLRCIDQGNMSLPERTEQQVEAVAHLVGLPVRAVSAGVTAEDKHLVLCRNQQYAA